MRLGGDSTLVSSSRQDFMKVWLRIELVNQISCFLSMYSTRNTSTLFRTKNDNLQKVLSVVILLATALHIETPMIGIDEMENHRKHEPFLTRSLILGYSVGSYRHRVGVLPSQQSVPDLADTACSTLCQHYRLR
jgi:hypothetical protein